MKVVSVTAQTLPIYLSLAQAYEAEFSNLTRKVPDERGLFSLDTRIGGDVKGFLAFEGETPIGLAAVAVKPVDHFEICEFYIVPVFRKRERGMRFAHALWGLFPGEWEVKQIAGAEYASQFWRKSIASFVGVYEEDRYEDPYWGPVTRQRFSARPTFIASAVSESGSF